MNTHPPATLDGQKVVQNRVSIWPQRTDLGDSWPHGTNGVCFALQTTQPAPVLGEEPKPFPNQVSVIATHGGGENFWAHAIVTDFDQPIVWKNGAVCNGPLPQFCWVLFRNADIHGDTRHGPGVPSFPPKHPPKSGTLTTAKAYHAT